MTAALLWDVPPVRETHPGVAEAAEGTPVSRTGKQAEPLLEAETREITPEETVRKPAAEARKETPKEDALKTAAEARAETPAKAGRKLEAEAREERGGEISPHPEALKADRNRKTAPAENTGLPQPIQQKPRNGFTAVTADPQGASREWNTRAILSVPRLCYGGIYETDRPY